jgi:glycosyltransferase involved in cell wall biosynthesis
MNTNVNCKIRPLVSIIVPVYNVEMYLRQCIESISSQSYEKLEMIFINDGSPDLCGQILDEYASKDSRIIVIHQNNQGVSKARNAGLDRASGVYLCFVDSDDCISERFVEDFLTVAEEKSSDFVISSRQLESPNDIYHNPEVCSILTAVEATELLLYADITIGSWNKFYKRELIENLNLRFLPEYFMGEGFIFVTTFAQFSKNTVITDSSNYFYRRDNINSVTSSMNVKKNRNALKAIDNIRNGLTLSDERVILALDFHQWLTSFYAIKSMKDSKTEASDFEFYNSCLSYVKENALRLFIKSRISKRRRLLTFITILSPLLAIWLLNKRATND